MPALNITFTDEEHRALREAAERENVSLRTFVHDAVVEAARSRKHVRDEILARINDKSAELHRRLA
ncbi:hypothetical protein [Rhodococcus spongiicola]|uniref:Antitoxin Phd n=1 Tax=Rhodococcus spongiicola TaxID=2487352 RepID=A0A3S3AA30_9NOCA|nr:hypothetical protein [Rhodococcus spongiicola]RVW03222.1 hypothetical protein EF834_08595 [Rhodococcus spongiicola]